MLHDQSRTRCMMNHIVTHTA
ncbi:hypothetical protein CY0110_17322 [Crocosphaera chwakensis CCY0110]|uniref:Uncharacterized protein n=1 Tax=Crocosphaera chwakensis CCY0110 TaxID=391612 RepID=A3IIE6_9CHRO|nr:hypothetical protein CY0110_17322 [Crocosphaera chwakensis CCY0110]